MGNKPSTPVEENENGAPAQPAATAEAPPPAEAFVAATNAAGKPNATQENEEINSENTARTPLRERQIEWQQHLSNSEHRAKIRTAGALTAAAAAAAAPTGNAAAPTGNVALPAPTGNVAAANTLNSAAAEEVAAQAAKEAANAAAAVNTPAAANLVNSTNATAANSAAAEFTKLFTAPVTNTEAGQPEVVEGNAATKEVVASLPAAAPEVVEGNAVPAVAPAVAAEDAAAAAPAVAAGQPEVVEGNAATKEVVAQLPEAGVQAIVQQNDETAEQAAATLAGVQAAAVARKALNETPPNGNSAATAAATLEGIKTVAAKLERVPVASLNQTYSTSGSSIPTGAIMAAVAFIVALIAILLSIFLKK